MINRLTAFRKHRRIKKRRSAGDWEGASERVPAVVCFGGFNFYPDSEELRRGDAPVALRPQVSRVLALLIQTPGRLVTRDEIRKTLWEDGVVEFEQGINACVRQLRAKLGDDASAPKFIQTIPKRGYRFIAPVTAASADPAEGEDYRWEKRQRMGWKHLVLAVVVLLLLAAGWQTHRLMWAAGTVAKSSVTLGAIPLQTHGHVAEARFRNELMRMLSTEIVDDSLGNVQVVPWRWGMTYDRSEGLVEEAGHDLGIDILLEGTVQARDGDLLISLYMFRVRDGARLWAESYRRGAADTVEVAHEITRAVTAVMASIANQR